MPRKLKLFRTAIGFHDAYVAAPSRKAALAAWGADADLFARGVAEEVTDETLAKDAFAHPGDVIRKVRGSMAEHLAALPQDQPKPKTSTAAKPAARSKRPAKPKPRPDRSALDAAEDALAQAEEAQDAERRALAEREAALRRERQALERRIDVERAELESARDTARDRYDRALEAWRAS